MVLEIRFEFPVQHVLQPPSEVQSNPDPIQKSKSCMRQPLVSSDTCGKSRGAEGGTHE